MTTPRGFRPQYRTLGEAVVAAQGGPRLVLAEAVELAAMDGAVARAIGVAVVRSPYVPRGTFLEDRTRGQLKRLVIGTDQADPLEAVRRDARRWVREGMASVTPYALRHRHAEQRRAEDLVDKLVGAPPAWPA